MVVSCIQVNKNCTGKVEAMISVLRFNDIKNYFLVLEKIYELLGVLGEVQPSDMINNSEKLFRAYLGELRTQV